VTKPQTGGATLVLAALVVLAVAALFAALVPLSCPWCDDTDRSGLLQRDLTDDPCRGRGRLTLWRRWMR
jgi:hypothetical protein